MALSRRVTPASISTRRYTEPTLQCHSALGVEPGFQVEAERLCVCGRQGRAFGVQVDQWRANARYMLDALRPSSLDGRSVANEDLGIKGLELPGFSGKEGRVRREIHF